MRIIFVLPGFATTPIGGFRVVYEYSNCLVARGHDVTVVHPRPFLGSPPPPNVYRRLRRAGGKVRDRLFKPKVKWQHLDAKVKMLHVPNLVMHWVPAGDVIFATAWQTAKPVLDLPDEKGTKFYLVQHYETWAGPKEMVDSTWRFPMHKVVVAKWLYETGLSLGCDPNEITRISPGIDQSIFKLGREIQNRPARIAMMFSSQEWKGSSDGLKALEIAKSHVPTLKAILFGVAERPQSIPNWIEYWRDPPQAELVQKIYNSSSIYLAPSWTEGLGLPVAEAMACGCAVVSTDCGGVREYAEHGVNALLSLPHDAEALANNIVHLLNNDALRWQIAGVGHDRIKGFTWERSTNLMEKLMFERVALHK